MINKIVTVLFPQDVTIEVSEFISQQGRRSFHVMFHVNPRSQNFEGQFTNLCEAFSRFQNQFSSAEVKFARLFLSDATNQMSTFNSHFSSLLHIPESQLSIIHQPPLDGSKVALWAHFVADDCDEKLGIRHIWNMGMTCPEGSSYDQTKSVLETYESNLSHLGANIAENCVRTWFFVRDVDIQYQGLVDARRENFIREGLTEKTHYISSTGICGAPANTKAIVQLDTYTVLGLQKGQQRYLYAKSHLNPTYEYGVTFERGTAVQYPDRTEIFISGTASIDNKGNVVYPGDIQHQTERMLENVRELLKEADATFDDVMQIIVYLRDIADYQTVHDIFHDQFSQVPLIITYAPVCRPAWLIEMECIAMK
ncbi:MAG: Rid family hydrolase [Bacteroidaceae bacterium]|nr:Rid family hydrolase [Bacteroidaceae bacterium]